MITRLDHMQLAMPLGEEAKARVFFRDLLGMEEEAKPEPLASRGGCWFRGGSALLHIGVEKDFAPQRKGHPALCVTELDQIAERLKNGGCPVVWDEALPSRRRFYTADPFGNRIELIRDGDGFGQR
jgi:catechol 2,3-dioxygenase-like lactoylglutathione lyase family enzyme